MLRQAQHERKIRNDFKTRPARPESFDKLRTGSVEGRMHVSSLHFNEETSKSNHTRLAHSRVTLSEAKGLKDRFFAALRMTVLASSIVKCTNVLWSDLASSRGFISKCSFPM